MGEPDLENQNDQVVEQAALNAGDQFDDYSSISDDSLIHTPPEGFQNGSESDSDPGGAIDTPDGPYSPTMKNFNETVNLTENASDADAAVDTDRAIHEVGTRTETTTSSPNVSLLNLDDLLSPTSPSSLSFILSYGVSARDRRESTPANDILQETEQTHNENVEEPATEEGHPPEVCYTQTEDDNQEGIDGEEDIGIEEDYNNPEGTAIQIQYTSVRPPDVQRSVVVEFVQQLRQIAADEWDRTIGEPNPYYETPFPLWVDSGEGGFHNAP